MDYSRYPADWKEISLRIRTERANNQCEWMENGVRCAALNHQPHPITGNRVTLTVAHLNHTPMDVRDENLMAMCNLHHLRYDAKLHGKHAAETRLRKRLATGQQSLFEAP